MNARVILLGWMLVMVGGGLVMAREPASEAVAVSRDQASPRLLTAIQRDVYAALREESLSRRRGPNVAEVVRLMDLYREMAADPRRDTSAFLTELGLKVRSRLEDVCEHIERKSAKTEGRAKKKADVPADVVPETQVLAQQLGPGRGVPGQGQGQGGQPRGGRPGAGQSFDYGPELVDIIQRTISPATWDINGGRGAVVYFAQQRVLVVSAPGEVHPQIGNLLGQMRAAP